MVRPILKNTWPTAASTEATSPRSVADDHLHDAHLPIRQRRRYGSWAGAVVVLALLASIINSMINNPGISWGVVGDYLFNSQILHGVLVTVELTATSMAIALVIAVTVALMRLSEIWAFRQFAVVFVWFFRSVPVLVLLIMTFNLALLYPRIMIGIPGGPGLFSEDTNSLISPFLAAIIAFSLNEAAYAAEIMRSSILAVSKGQAEAGLALGMTKGRINRRIVLPQAARIAVPPLANDTINMLKGTALVAFIAVFDLMYTAESIYQLTYQVVPLLFVATFWYVVLVSILTVLQSLLERRLRGRSRRAGAAAAVAAVAGQHL